MNTKEDVQDLTSDSWKEVGLTHRVAHPINQKAVSMRLPPKPANPAAVGIGFSFVFVNSYFCSCFHWIPKVADNEPGFILSFKCA